MGLSHLCCLLWALAKLELRPTPKYVAALVDVCRPSLASAATTKDLVQLVSALSAFGHPSPTWLGPVLADLEHRLGPELQEGMQQRLRTGLLALGVSKAAARYG